MKRMEPPKDELPYRVVFWFLQWHRAKYGEAFRFRFQYELARASGVSDAVISRLINQPPSWFIYDGKSADAKNTSEL